jgi:hypothetical protein
MDTVTETEVVAVGAGIDWEAVNTVQTPFRPNGPPYSPKITTSVQPCGSVTLSTPSAN